MEINSNELPTTIGELRRRLAILNNPWQVDPHLSDDDPLPEPLRGGQRDEEIADEHRLRPLEDGVNLQDLIASQPPANPFLRARWAEKGMLSQEETKNFPSKFDDENEDNIA